MDMHLTLPNGEKYMSSTIPSHHYPGICVGSVKTEVRNHDNAAKFTGLL